MSSSAAGWLEATGGFATWHRPDDGQARGIVVLVPSLGSEQLWGYLALVELAEQLADAGFAVLRIDLAGTGHSEGDLGDHFPAGTLQRSVLGALDHAAACGELPLAAVGYRLGGTLLASLAEPHPPLHAIALWDPIVRGRTFVRQQRSMLTMALDRLADDPETVSDDEISGVELPGFVYDERARGEIEALHLDPSSAAGAPRVLVGHTGTAGPLEPFVLGVGAATFPVTDSDDLLAHGTVPSASVEHIVTWLSGQFPVERGPVTDPALATSIVDEVAGTVERTERLGPNRLAAWVTEPIDGSPSRTTIFVSTAREPSIGPGRLWVRVGRELARQGQRSVRLDLGGIADSPPRADGVRNRPYSAHAPSDILDACEGLDLDLSTVAVVGSCSGAFNSLEAASIAPLGRVIAINPILDLIPSDAGMVGDRSVATPRRKLLRSRGAATHRRPPLPESAWRAMHVLRIQRSPSAGLVAATAHTHVTMLCGPEDARRYRDRGGWITRRLVRQGRMDFSTVDGLDHALLLTRPRRVVHRLIEEALQDPADQSVVNSLMSSS